MRMSATAAQGLAAFSALELELVVLSHEGARPAGWTAAQQWPLLPQGLLELKQACPTLDDFSDHEAG